ncbi:Translocon-associated protein subunit beta [Intoshia linei]|uniref:Translocon-associated protein subunit beta n=1 Tax=Intoshia linei TaxID=1819745 RepID=A0A177BCJ4_9BILA|nr:Translocon-associated protein subunit beta [Intoshia linei]
MIDSLKNIIFDNDKFKLKIRLGIHTGPIMAAIVKTKITKLYLFGDTYDIANKIETLARPMSVYITENTLKEIEKFNPVTEKEDPFKYKSSGHRGTPLFVKNMYKDNLISCDYYDKSGNFDNLKYIEKTRKRHANENTGCALFSKQILNNYIVQNRNLYIKYTIYNAEERPMYSIYAIDKSFDSDDFELIGGSLSAKIDIIMPFSNATFMAIIQPKMYGYHTFKSADMEYSLNQDGSNPNKMFSSPPGTGLIIYEKTYSTNFEHETSVWFFYGLVSVLFTLVPFLVWRSSVSSRQMKLKCN